MNEMKVVTITISAIENSIVNECEKLNYVYEYVVNVSSDNSGNSGNMDNDIASKIRSYLINLPYLHTREEIQNIIKNAYQEYDKTIEFNKDSIEAYHTTSNFLDEEIIKNGKKGINTYTVSITVST